VAAARAGKGTNVFGEAISRGKLAEWRVAIAQHRMAQHGMQHMIYACSHRSARRTGARRVAGLTADAMLCFSTLCYGAGAWPG
jgi:hypothetical protein